MRVGRRRLPRMLTVSQCRLFQEQLASFCQVLGLDASTLDVRAFKSVHKADFGEEGLKVLLKGPNWDRRTCARFFEKVQV